MAVKMFGVSAMQARLRQIATEFPDRVAAALYAEGNVEMTESKRRVPFEFGILKASGHVQDPVRSGRNISVTLAYGGAAEDYAIVQHERLDYVHPLGGQAKYLESVLNESRQHMAARIAARVDLNKE